MAVVCAGCDWNSFEIDRNFQDKERLFDFLLSHNLIVPTCVCPKCQRVVSVNPKTLSYRCDRTLTGENKRKQVTRCRFFKSALKGTFFEKAHLPLDKILLLSYLFLTPQKSVSYVSRELRISKTTITEWFGFCHEVLVYYCVSKREKIGGVGKIVELYETEFGKHKYHRGRLMAGNWAIGGFQRDTKQLFFVPQEGRSDEKLVNIVQEYIFPDTTIIADCWSSCHGLRDHGYIHKTVNHSRNFVDQSLAEYLFKKCFTKMDDRFHNFMLLAGELYSF